MGNIRTFFMRLWSSSEDSYQPPPVSEQELEAKRQHELQMRRLKVAIESRKRIDSSVEKIAQEFINKA